VTNDATDGRAADGAHGAATSQNGSSDSADAGTNGRVAPCVDMLEQPLRLMSMATVMASSVHLFRVSMRFSDESIAVICRSLRLR